MDSTLIRVQGNRAYWDNVAILARLRRTSVAALVKDAVDALYSEKLNGIEPLFLQENDAIQQHSNDQMDSEHA